MHCICYSWLNYSMVDGHLVHFHLSAIVNDSGVTIGVQISLWEYWFQCIWYILRSEIPGLYSHLRKCLTVFHTAFHSLHFYHLAHELSSFSTALPTLASFCFSILSQQYQLCVKQYRAFDVHFQMSHLFRQELNNLVNQNWS